jgi:hypothetical protein
MMSSDTNQEKYDNTAAVMCVYLCRGCLQANLLSALAVFGATPNRAWLAAFQLLMVQQAEAGKMDAQQLEQVGWLLLLVSYQSVPFDHPAEAAEAVQHSSSPCSAAVIRAAADEELLPHLKTASGGDQQPIRC